MTTDEQIKVVTEKSIDTYYQYLDFTKNQEDSYADNLMVFEFSVMLDRLVRDNVIDDYRVIVKDMVPTITYSPRSSYMELLEVDFNRLEREREEKLKDVLDE